MNYKYAKLANYSSKKNIVSPGISIPIKNLIPLKFAELLAFLKYVKEQPCWGHFIVNYIELGPSYRPTTCYRHDFLLEIIYAEIDKMASH